VFFQTFLRLQHLSLSQLMSQQIKLHKCTVIPRYTRNLFTSFRLYEMHKLIPFFFFSIYEPIFAHMSSFLSQTDRCSRRLFLGSNGKFIFVLRVFALQAVLEERMKLVNRGISVVNFILQHPVAFAL
jgi:hypothetical protein